MKCTQSKGILAKRYDTTDFLLLIYKQFRTGFCTATASGPLSPGNVTALLNVGMCDGFNETYNSFTGFGSAVSMVIEDYPKRELCAVDIARV